MTGGQKTAVRIGLVILAIAALAYSGVSLWSNAGPARGSEKDEILLTCSKCNQDSVVSSGEYAKLARDPQGSASACPKCGAMAAVIASTRCPKCQRGIPPQPPSAPLVCPFCKASLRDVGDDSASAGQ